MFETFIYLRKVAALKKLEKKLQKLTIVRMKAKQAAGRVQAKYEALTDELTYLKKV